MKIRTSAKRHLLDLARFTLLWMTYNICRQRTNLSVDGSTITLENCQTMVLGLKQWSIIITQKCPLNCIVVGKRLLRKKEVNIEYGVICDCAPPVFDQKGMRNPSCLEAFRYLNINDNIKM